STEYGDPLRSGEHSQKRLKSACVAMMAQLKARTCWCGKNGFSNFGGQPLKYPISFTGFAERSTNEQCTQQPSS
ncbi:MAG: hypothetical protein NTW02_12625, partial [Cyanobium sp. LacPavin_0920_WC12_MAG_62_9]|nr:hypothetical protein [Cyanobium sp. LacPavin_0920_WC12_MAG_62_9]